MQPSTGPTAVQRIALVASAGRDLAELAAPLLSRLVALRHKPFCLAPDFDPLTSARLASLGAEALPIVIPASGLNPLASFTARRAALATLRLVRPHGIVAYDLAAASALAPLSIRARTARVVALLPSSEISETSDPSGQQHIDLTGAKERQLRQLMSSCTSVLVPSADDQRRLKVLEFNAGVPVEVAAASSVDLTMQPLVRAAPIAGGLRFLSYAPAFTLPEMAALVAAARQVAERQPTAELRIIGALPPGNDRGRAQALIAGCDPLSFDERTDTLTDEIASCHVFIHPSRRPGLTRGLLAALAMGRPLIVTDTPAARETVDQVINGVLVMPDDAGSLADAMLTILRRVDLLPAMALASRRKAERRFDSTTTNAIVLGALGVPASLGSVV